jgi:hypothetical protein
VAPKGAKSVAYTGSRAELMVTAVVTGNAVGRLLPITFLWQGKRPRYAAFKGFPECSHGMTPAGGQTAESYRDWADAFIEGTGGKGYGKPRALLLDSHYSHLDLDATLTLREAGITIIAYPPHTTHALSPLDVSFFGPMKDNLSSVRTTFSTTTGSPLEINDVAKLWRMALLRLLKKASFGDGFSAAVAPQLAAGFKAAGLVPFDPAGLKAKHAGAIAAADKLRAPPKVPVVAPTEEEEAAAAEDEAAQLAQLKEHLDGLHELSPDLKKRQATGAATRPHSCVLTSDEWLEQRKSVEDEKTQEAADLEARKEARAARKAAKAAEKAARVAAAVARKAVRTPKTTGGAVSGVKRKRAASIGKGRKVGMAPKRAAGAASVVLQRAAGKRVPKPKAILE